MTDPRAAAGSAGGGGYDYQARVSAFVAVHALVQRPLGWLGELVHDVPVLMDAEARTAGDDLRIQLASHVVLDAQVKHGLRADRHLYEVIDRFAEKLGRETQGLLIVDPTSSRSIRRELRNDLRWLSRRMEEGLLHPVTRRVLARLRAHPNVNAYELAARLSIVEVDVEHLSSHGRTAALAWLSRLVEDPAQLDLAWSTLYEDALVLIRERGRRDADAIGRLLQRSGVRLADATAASTTARYADWLVHTTATFTVAGLGVALPITNAWAQLQALRDDQETARPATVKAQIAAYHEWERLARRDRVAPAQDVAEFGHRVIIVGGPGSGKSTLCRRVANSVASSGERVLWVRLPMVARRMRQGRSIEEALVEVATDGFTMVDARLRQELDSPDALVADGLDECHPYRWEVAAALARWSQARPSTRVVVTTRPVGHDPSMFSSWPHAELLPLETRDIDEYAARLIRAVRGQEPTAAIQAFKSELDRNRVASLAARNPLLLGFLVQLSLARAPMGERRAALYEDILDLWQQRRDHEFTVELEAPVARRAVHIIGWELHSENAPTEGISERTLTDRVGRELSRDLALPRLAAMALATRCIAYWEERGVIEHLRTGVDDAYTFIHASLCEYAAAQYVVSLEAAARRKWLANGHRDPGWRETILLAAGIGPPEEIVEALLAWDELQDPAAAECLLAAAALAEAKTPLPSLVQRVVQRVANRLTSPAPLVAYEAAAAAVDLASQTPELFGAVLRPLARHSQPWTRVAALRLLIAAGDNFIDFDALEECLGDPPVERGIQPGLRAPVFQTGHDSEWGIWNDVVVLGARALFGHGRVTTAAEHIEGLVREGALIGSRSASQLRSILAQLGRPPVLDSGLSGLRLADTLGNTERDRSADRALLEAVLRVCGGASSSNSEPRRMVALGALIHGLQLPEHSVQAWSVLAERESLETLDAVLAAAIYLLDIDRIELARDVTSALARMMDDPSLWLIRIPPYVPTHIDWNRAADAPISADVLVKALLHPSMIVAFVAAQLLSAGAGGTRAASLVEDVINSDDEQALEVVSLIAAHVWRDRALEIVLARLRRGFSLGSRHLLRVLPKLPGAPADRRTQETLILALTADDSRVAATAAAALRQIDAGQFYPVVPPLQQALALWTERGALCERCGTYVRGGSCPKHNVVPDSPRADLVRLLVRDGGITAPELVALSGDSRHDVWQAATEGLPVLLSGRVETTRQIVYDIAAGRCPQRALLGVLSLPRSELALVGTELTKLLNSSSVLVRREVLDSLANSRWLSRADSLAAARIALSDSDRSVRDHAVRALRKLRQTDSFCPPSKAASNA